MIWCVEQNNLLKPAEGNSGASPFCTPTSVGSFIGDSQVKQILLTQGKFAIVDDEDFEWLNQWRWCAARAGDRWYAVRLLYQSSPRSKKNLFMHREILGLKRKDGKQTDHVNHNGLDNRRCNIRKCSNTQNQYNQKPRKGCSSKYKGVSWSKVCEKWKVAINHIHLGYFDNEIEAVKVYDKTAKELFGEFAYTNF